MSYLHQHKICHGRLKSLNCVLDDRWVCKITGKATLKGTVRSLHRGIMGGVVFIVKQISLPIKKSVWRVSGRNVYGRGSDSFMLRLVANVLSQSLTLWKLPWIKWNMELEWDGKNIYNCGLYVFLHILVIHLNVTASRAFPELFSFTLTKCHHAERITIW